MNDDVEARLGADLRRPTLPAAPDALRARVQAIPAHHPHARVRRRVAEQRRWAVIAAAVIVVAVAGFGALALSGGKPLASTAAPSATASPSGSPSPPPIADASFPTTVDGQPVLTISEAIAKRDGGKLGTDPVAVRGFWSNGSVGHSCAAPDAPTGELEIYCHDREWGMTELDEPIMVIDQQGYTTEGAGPWLTPWIGQEIDGIQALFSLPIINGQRFPPVPIVVVGHFDDPRAADCRPAAKELCRDRLVVDRIVVFARDAVPPPAPTPSPTPFPFADPPPAPYPVDQCAEGHPVSFTGWTTLASLGIDIASPNEIAYIVITKDPIPIGGWFDDPNDGTRYRLWGQRVCYGYERDEGAVGYTAIPGTYFREYPDGRREPTPGP
jgi:hypothetical protein